ncbi:MAG TPA: Clp protease N-terminal domain-containing protein [Puia sp.]|nr:Clp protease N-terminal domain-containing protein [Puia sp.]
MSNTYSNTVKEVISISREEAQRLKSNTIVPEHLMLGIMRHGQNKVMAILKDLRVDVGGVQRAMETAIKTEGEANKNGSKAKVGKLTDAMSFSKEAENILKAAGQEAILLHSKKVEVEHLLLSALKQKGIPMADVFSTFDVRYDNVISWIAKGHHD